MPGSLERKREYSKEYRRKNPEKIREYKKEYLRKNPEEIREYNKRYRTPNSEKIREYQKLYYIQNPERNKEWFKNNPEKVEQYNKNRKKASVLRVLKFGEYKVLIGCSICGYSKCPEALEFHHPNQNKELGVTSRNFLSDEGKKEIEKCILVCANCHREIHWRERNVQ